MVPECQSKPCLSQVVRFYSEVRGFGGQKENVDVTLEGWETAWFWDSFATDCTVWAVVEEVATCRVCMVCGLSDGWKR